MSKPSNVQYKPSSLQLPGGIGRQPYPQHQQHHGQGSTPMSSAVQHGNGADSLNMAMLTGVSQLSDMNFNDLLYSPTRMGSGSNNSFDSYDSWSGGGSGAGAGFHQIQNSHQTQGQNMIPQQMHINVGSIQSDISGTMGMMERGLLLRTPSASYPSLSRQNSLQQMDNMNLINSGNSGKLRELLSSAAAGGGVADANPGADRLLSSPSDQKALSGQANQALRKLLQAADEGDEMGSVSTAAATAGYSTPAALSSSAGSASKTTTTHTDSSNLSPSASATRKVADHQILKKLLSDDLQPDESDKNTGLLQKLDKVVTSGLKKSPTAPSPTGSNSGGKNNRRRFSSGSSNKDGSNKTGRWEDSGRGTKRKISGNTTSTISPSSAIATAEPDSTGVVGGAAASAAAATNTHLLNQLLTKKTSDTSIKADPYDITSTPLERRQAQLLKTKRGGLRAAGQADNVVDVVNDTIMLGKEQMSMERFTSMIRSTETTNMNNVAPVYHRQGSASNNYTSELPLYGNHQQHQQHQQQYNMSNPMDTGQHLSSDLMRAYNSNTKDYFSSNSLGAGPLLPAPTSQSQDNSLIQLGFQHMPTTKEASNRSTSPSSASMLQQLLDPDADIIQELENLLGNTGPSMQTISPEDELAIRDIEQQLLISVENLPGSGGRYAAGQRISEPHSPGFGMGLADVPAPASNPVHANVKLNISHKPIPSLPSNSNAQMYSGHPFQSSPQHSLRGQLQQGMPRGSSMAAIRANRRAGQNSGPGRPVLDGKLRRHSGSSPGSSISSFSPLANTPLNQQPMQGSFIPNFGEMMKSKDPPPNIKLPQDLNSNSFPPRDMMHHELTSPRTSRGLQQNYPTSPMDMPSSPTHFRFPDRYGGQQRQPMLPRQQQLMATSMANQSYHSDQIGIRSNQQHHLQQPHQQQQQQQQQHMMMSTNMHSPQGVRPGGAPMDTSPVLPPAQPNHIQQQYNQVDQWILSQQSQRVSSNVVTSSQYVKNDLRAKLAAKAQQQNTSPKHQNFKSHQQAMLTQHMAMMSPPPGPMSASTGTLRQPTSNTDNFYPSPFSSSSAAMSEGAQEMPIYEDSVLPDDILDQITELTDTQNEIQQKQKQQQQEHQFSTLTNSNDNYDSHAAMNTDQDIALKKMDQSKLETSQVRAQLRALAGTSPQPEGSLDKVFRNLLTSPTATSASSSIRTEQIDMAKLKQSSRNSNVSIISIDRRTPIGDLQPNDQRNSLLQKLLTDSPRVLQ